MFQRPWAHARPSPSNVSCESGEKSARGPWPCGPFGPWGFGEFGGPFMHHGPFGEMFERQFSGRRPLRFLAHKLDLDEKQFSEFSKIIDEIKTERAQAAVDDRRTLADYAEAMAADTFDAAKVNAGAARRAESIARVNAVLLKSLERMHAILDPEQRRQFADLIRAGFVQP